MNFKIKINKIKNTPVVEIIGELVGSNVGKVSSKLESIKNSGGNKIAIDLRKTTFIDSHGLGVFVFFQRRLTEDKKELVFLKPSDFIMDIFEGANLTKIFNIIDDEDKL
ncbi:MAG: STAS domain-containing protein [Chitinispirillaceae bacterium]|nr:STAS domain-containing protein [Chitinispirillaceae bacterium]